MKNANTLKIKGGRGGQIRTDDFLLPKQALYQAELRPATGRTLGDSATRIKNFLAQNSFALFFPKQAEIP